MKSKKDQTQVEGNPQNSDGDDKELSLEELEEVSGGTEGASQSRKTVVSGGVLNHKAISKPQPAYPPIA